MKIKYIKLPIDDKKRKYFEACGLIYVHYPEYSKVTNDLGNTDYYLKVTFDTWEEHLLKGIKTMQEVAQYGPIIKLYDGPNGLYEKLIFIFKEEGEK